MYLVRSIAYITFTYHAEHTSVATSKKNRDRESKEIPERGESEEGGEAARFVGVGFYGIL